MGYWNEDLFGNDYTMDFIDGNSLLLKKAIEKDPNEPSNYYSAAIFVRGVAYMADVVGTDVPITVIELAKTFNDNVDSALNYCYPGFVDVLAREKRAIQWFLASDKGLIALKEFNNFLESN